MPQIDSIAAGAPSENLLQAGDRFAELEGLAWPSISEIQTLVSNSPKPQATIQRGATLIKLELPLRSDGKLGIGLSPASRPLQLTGSGQSYQEEAHSAIAFPAMAFSSATYPM